jgi:hypothetical protein
MEVRTHEPLDVHAHVADDGVGAQHVFFDTLALVEHHHICTALELGHCVGDARHFLAKGVVERKEVVHL